MRKDKHYFTVTFVDGRFKDFDRQCTYVEPFGTAGNMVVLYNDNVEKYAI